MNLPENWPLVDPCDDGIRPAGSPDHCFYCYQKVGQPHKRDCVVVRKRVRFRCTVEGDIDVPHSWTKEEIENSTLMDGVFEELSAGTLESYKCEYMGIVDETPRRALRNQN